MPYYARRGSVPSKHHVQFRRPDGALYAEEGITTRGFEDVFSLLYHVHPPTAVLEVRSWTGPECGHTQANEPLRNRHFAAGRISSSGDAVAARVSAFENDDLRIGVATVDRTMEYFYRNVGGDELLFVHEGSGRLETPFGELAYRAHDYLVIPAGTTYRLQPIVPTRLMYYDCAGAVRIPRRFRNDIGQFAEGAPYTERDFRLPELRDPQTQAGSYEVRIVARGRAAIHFLQYHPFDVVGWDGCVFPYAFNLADYAPIVGAVHQPPTAHATFEAPGAAFCAFVPRPADFHPEAIPIPYIHSSVDCDEVLYYLDGNFAIRSGIGAGSITLHPAGSTHGPQPGKVEASLGKAYADELAVMVDTFRPLRVSDALAAVEDAEYYRSWALAEAGSAR